MLLRVLLPAAYWVPTDHASARTRAHSEGEHTQNANERQGLDVGAHVIKNDVWLPEEEQGEGQIKVAPDAKALAPGSGLPTQPKA